MQRPPAAGHTCGAHERDAAPSKSAPSRTLQPQGQTLIGEGGSRGRRYGREDKGQETEEIQMLSRVNKNHAVFGSWSIYHLLARV